jgi:phosphoribosylformylglycinamidine cyclo-ligase
MTDDFLADKLSSMTSESKSAYAQAGVDIDAQDKVLAKIKKLVRSTFTDAVLSDVGSFGGLFKLPVADMAEPILVASADGVGTKLMVARHAGDFSTVGRDLVNHCVNDILVQGARPLFFLDYVGAGVLEPRKVVDLVSGVAAACKDNKCALLGGEMAEMPGFYDAGDYELVGFIVGIVERAQLIDGSKVQPRDLLIGLPSSGLHTNGYSLVRRIVFEELGLSVKDRLPGVASKEKVGKLLMAPHRSYLAAVSPLLVHQGLHAVAHITGGGLTDNVPRVLPGKCHAEIRVGSWEIPEIFYFLQEHGQISTEEMFRVFNMGVGMVLIIDPESAGEVLGILRHAGQRAFPIGTVQQGSGGVVYDLPSEP